MASDFTSEMFNAFTQKVRTDALPALKARADREGLIITTCGWCNAYMGEQPGRGVSGISTGICNACVDAQRLGSPLAVREGAVEDEAANTQDATPEAAPSPFFEPIANGMLP